jgi:hypothetical protein
MESTPAASTAAVDAGFWRRAGPWLAVAMVLVALVVFGYAIPAYQGSVHRMRMTEVIGELGRVRAVVSGEILARKRDGGAPAGGSARDLRSESRMVTKVSVDPGAGTITAFIDHERFNHQHVRPGSSVTWTAAIDGAKVEWKCSSATVPPKLLPAACR